MTVKLRLIVEFSNTLMRWVLNDIWHCFGILLKKNVPTWLWAGLEVEELHLFVSQTRFGLVPYPSVVAVLSQVTNEVHHPKEITNLTITPHWYSNQRLKREVPGSNPTWGNIFENFSYCEFNNLLCSKLS